MYLHNIVFLVSKRLFKFTIVVVPFCRLQMKGTKISEAFHVRKAQFSPFKM